MNNLNILKLKNLTSFNKNCTADTNILIYNKKQIINFINFSIYIKQALKLKHIYVENISFSLLGKDLLINATLYYSSLKLSLLKKKSKLVLSSPAVITPALINKNTFFPRKFILANKLNYATFKFININTAINNSKTLTLYKSIKNSLLLLLKKKKYLLIDFIRITVLLTEAKISVKLFTIFIGQIFATLSKKSHNRFFLILKKLFKIIISETKQGEPTIKGIKLKMGGRLRGKTRSDVRTLTVGTVPLQSSCKNIDYFKQHIFTIYGTFGLKIWVYRNL